MVDGLAAERGDVQDGASPAAMVLERAAAIRASLRSPDDEDFVGCFRRDAPASMARMARPGVPRRVVLALTGCLAEGVEEPKKPSWAVRS